MKNKKQIKETTSGDHNYGRGKFTAHPNYIEYMKMIANSKEFRDMPNSVSEDGRINWQVSSGKTTSFYPFYLARRTWWINKADSLGLPGTGQENDRFTIAARKIHPTGYRVCRLCGKEFNVGYFYLNAIFARRLNSRFPGMAAAKGESIEKTIEELEKLIGKGAAHKLMREEFSERTEYFDQLGVCRTAFEKTNFIRSRNLSPGFMGNPPDRLDGFHDYHFACRKANDPGRSDENMRSYARDRRSFEWWAEGNWALADALYNKAGPGRCAAAGCDEELIRVSPDHVGPLACGFKQMPFFTPTCTNHNSAKNRRFSAEDVRLLIEYEEQEEDSVASWQVREHWDKYKVQVKSDEDAKALSNSMRSLQDMHLRVLHELLRAGKARLLATLLKPELALWDFEFEGLDAATFRYSAVVSIRNESAYRTGFAARTIRIAIDSLSDYASKVEKQRKMVRADFEDNITSISDVVNKISSMSCPGDDDWEALFNSNLTNEQKEERISHLLKDSAAPICQYDTEAKALLGALFDRIGGQAPVDFDKYGQQSDL